MPQHESGLGYEAKRPVMLSHTPLRVTQDMWALDEARMKQLASFRIVNEVVQQLHGTAKKHLDWREAALAAKDYQTADAQAREAWGYEARAYPAVLDTINDVVKGVLFYLALMLPFAFFFERLVFAFPNLRSQIIGFLCVFVVTCVVFAFIHPAFEITKNPWIVPLAFIMVALSVLVITLVVTKFEGQLKEWQMKVSGVHRADIGRMGVASAAFSLGVSNMRKRKARTLFTCLTLVLLTFTVLSFTSVKTGTRFNDRGSKGSPAYQGLLVRNAMWEPLEESAYRVLEDEFGRTRDGRPAGLVLHLEGGCAVVHHRRPVRPARASFDARAVTGLTPAEAKVTHLDRTLQAGAGGSVRATCTWRSSRSAWRTPSRSSPTTSTR